MFASFIPRAKQYLSNLINRTRQPSHPLPPPPDLTRPPSNSPTPSPHPWTTHTANLTLYTILSTPSPHRPALPPEILLQILSNPTRHILTHAPLFPPPHSTFSAPICVPSSRSPRTILTAGPLSKHEARTATKIVFTFTGKDQGWSSFREEHGGYANTWSWFEAHVRAGEGGGAQAHPAGEGGGEEQEERKWVLQRNRHAGKVPEAYTVVFGEGDAMLEGLREGDCVELVACAMFAGWECQIYEAGVEVWCVDELAEGVGDCGGRGG